LGGARGICGHNTKRGRSYWENPATRPLIPARALRARRSARRRINDTVTPCLMSGVWRKAGPHAWRLVGPLADTLICTLVFL
jgi:hypothetical protein